jgi:porin
VSQSNAMPVAPFFFEMRMSREAMKYMRIMSIAALLLLVAASGHGQENIQSDSKIDLVKSRFEKFGVRLEGSYIGEFWSNLRGGKKSGQTNLHNIDIAALLNTKQVGLWNNGVFFAHVLSSPGGRLLTEDIIGDSQTASNIEAPHSTRLYELWYEHRFFDDRLSFLAGIHDLNSEFASSEYGSMFINSSFGISKDISGGARPGVFAIAAPAISARYSPKNAWEFKLGLYNGDPGDPGEHRNFPRFSFNRRSGALLTFETAYHYGAEAAPGAIKAGYWKNTGKFDDLLEVDDSGNSIRRDGNEGFYLIADKMISFNEDHGLGVFLQLGFAPNGSINEFQSYAGGGINYAGLIPHRGADEIGVAVAHARVSDKLINCGRKKSETTLEFTYRMAINKKIAIQPDVQFILNPGAAAGIRNAVVAGMRFKVSF